jgi:RNA polymerase sigma-70 factor (ECF subfamily)
MAPLLAQRARSDRAFEKLYQRHAGDVYRYALVVMRNRDDAEDVTQTTFMNAYRAFARGERPRTPQNWLIAIAHNVCRQRFRQLQRQPSEAPLEEDEVAQLAPDDEAPSAEDIRRALSHLAFNQRAALVMRELEGRSYAEIAEVLQVSTSAVETLIFRARRALREQLEGGLTCREAEFAISRQLDGRLGRKEKGALRAHLRECGECATFARSQRAQRAAIRSLALIPLPPSLTSFFHHGSTAAGASAGAGAMAGGGVAVKAALVGATAIVAGGVGVAAAHKSGFHLRHHHPAPPTHVSRPSVQQAPTASQAAAPRVSHAVAVHAQVKPRLRARLAAEKPTNLHGRLREEARTADETSASVVTAPGQVKKLAGHPAKPLHPEHPVEPARPAHPAKPTHPTKPEPPVTPPAATKPPKHEPSPPGQGKKAETTPTATTTTPSSNATKPPPQKP